jgi:hypothetical protein
VGLAGTPRPHLATAKDIDNWGETMAARWDVARLVRSLIIQTNDRATPDMRAGEQAELPGYDGLVDSPLETFFVPEGHSVWELGTGQDPGDKASRDYKSRTDDPLGEDRANTTFVFATPRVFKGKRDWVTAKKKDSPWKDVRAYDADDLEMALEQAPGTHFIFSDLLGKPAFGVQGLEEWWRLFSTVSSPALTEAMVLAGRNDVAAALLLLLQRDSARTTIAAVSTDDAFALIAAAICAADANQRLDLFSRCIVVRDAHALRILARTAKLLILLPYDEALQKEAELIKNHNIVLLAQPDMPAEISGGDLDEEKFAELLRKEGVEEEKARGLARAAGRSLVAFQRQAAAPGALLRPQWSAWFKLKAVRRAWLAGGWVELRSGDKDVMSALIGTPLDDVMAVLREAASGVDPILVVVGQVWGDASPEAGWDYLRPHLASPDLAALEEAVQTVLGAVDPALELPVEDRWKAAIHGKSRIHSSNLRQGLGTTLSLLGSLGDRVSLSRGATARTWAERTVGRLLERANADQTGKLWMSLSDVLPQLAEAAPDQFLGAVQSGATGQDPVLRKMFVDKDDSFTTSSPHPGLLWALEGIAWSSDHLGLAAECLALLAEVDPGGRLSNRPAKSLASVFRPWLPQTSASPEARLHVLQSVRTRHPDSTWHLLIDLLPATHAIGTYTHAPRFRDWRKRPPKPVPAQEYRQSVSGVIDQLLVMVDATPERWPAIIERLPDLPPPKRADVYERLKRLGTTG